MTHPSRRELLGILGGSVGVAVAGCADVSEGQFVIVNTLFQQHPESDFDVQVRVELENRRSESQPALLTVNLEHDPPGGASETYTEERELNVPKGSSPIYQFRFRNVISGEFVREEYSVSSELEERE